MVSEMVAVALAALTSRSSLPVVVDGGDARGMVSEMVRVRRRAMAASS
jgi:hypothetical protein